MVEGDVERGAGVDERAAGPVRGDLDRVALAQAGDERGDEGLRAARLGERHDDEQPRASRSEVLDAAACGGRAAVRRSRRPAARGTATADRSARRSCGAARSGRTAHGWRRTRRSPRRAGRTRARARPRAASSSRRGSRRGAPGRPSSRSTASFDPAISRRASSRESVVSTGCVSVCGSKRTRPARSSARSSSQPATAGIAPAAYQGKAASPAIAPGNDEDRAREAVLAQDREGVLEDVAVAVVERERDRGLVRARARGRRSRRGRRRAGRWPRARPSGGGMRPA